MTRGALHVSSALRTRQGRKFAQQTASRYDAVAGSILAEVIKNKALRSSLSPNGHWRSESFSPFFLLPIGLKALIFFLGIRKVDTEQIIQERETALENFRVSLNSLNGAELLDAALHSLSKLTTTPNGIHDASVVLAAEAAFNWLKRKMKIWLGEPNVADRALSFLRHDPTLAMGMELHDIARLVTGNTDVCAHMAAGGTNAFTKLPTLPGGAAVHDSMIRFLERYGSRGPGEIDIARTRWRDKPESLFPLILAQIAGGDESTGEERLARGEMRAEDEAEMLLQRLSGLWGGKRKARGARRVLSLWRKVGGYREYMKFYLVRLFDLIRDRILEEADHLVENGVLTAREDVFYLFIDELREAIRTGRADQRLIEERRKETEIHSKLVAPHVLTSEGECLTPTVSPASGTALTGIAVSSGIAVGKVYLADGGAPEGGGILVIQHPEPSLTPLFAAASGVVSESGGILSHGAVIAREYGIPAVMGVEGASRKLIQGRTVRLDGGTGRVELL